MGLKYYNQSTTTKVLAMGKSWITSEETSVSFRSLTFEVLKDLFRDLASQFATRTSYEGFL
jgi:hypothetical protein